MPKLLPANPSSDAPHVDDMIELNDGLVVTRSHCEHTVYHAMLTSIQHGLPLQTGDVAVRVRSQMAKHPLGIKSGVRDCDYSECPQWTSDILSLGLVQGGWRLHVASLESMYPKDYRLQAKTARRIGFGLIVDNDDALASKIYESSGQRLVDIPLSDSRGLWPLCVPLEDYPRKDKMLDVFFPTMGDRYWAHLFIRKFSYAQLFLLHPSDYARHRFTDNHKVMISPISLGGVGIIPGLETRDHIVAGCQGDLFTHMPHARCYVPSP